MQGSTVSTDGREHYRGRLDRQQHLAQVQVEILHASGIDLLAHQRIGVVGQAELDAFGPRGKYGRWIRERKAVLQVDGTIFMHAGLNPNRPTTVDDVNRAVQRDLQWWDALSRTLERERLVAPFFTLEEVINAAQVELLQD